MKNKQKLFLSIAISTSLVVSSVSIQAQGVGVPACTQEQAKLVNCDGSGKAGWLVLMLITTLKETSRTALTNQSTSFFNDWFGWLLKDARPKEAQNNADTRPTSPSITGTGPSSPPAAPASLETMQQGLGGAIATPLIAISATMLMGPEANAEAKPNGEIALLQAGSEPLRFTVKSGDVFALLFSPTTPGMVKISSVDSIRTMDIDLYTVLPGQNNRLPRAGRGGLVVDDTPGLETLRVIFEPCIPSNLANEPTVQAFSGKLPRCTLALNDAKKSWSASANGKNVSKGFSLSQPGEGNKVGLLASGKDYKPGDLLTYDIVMDHIAR